MSRKGKIGLIAHIGVAWGSVVTIIIGYLVDWVNSTMNEFVASIIGSSVDSNVDIGKFLISTGLMASGHTHLGKHWFGNKK